MSSNRSRHSADCTNCQREFFPESTGAKFCDRNCAISWWSAIKPIPIREELSNARILANCETCGALHESYKSAGSRFCGAACRNVARKADLSSVPKRRICGTCDIVYPFTVEFFGARQKMAWGMDTVCRTCNNTRAKSVNKTERESLKRQVLTNYSGGDLRCVCCGIVEIEFLTIDHINNDGKKDREENPGSGVYRRLRREGYPPGYQTLCFNCNWARARYGECPHITKTRNSA